MVNPCRECKSTDHSTLSHYWTELRTLRRDDPRKKIVQQEINKIERWMQSKGIKKGALTKWNDGENLPETYPHHTAYIYFDDLQLIGDFNGSGVNVNWNGEKHDCKFCV